MPRSIITLASLGLACAAVIGAPVERAAAQQCTPNSALELRLVADAPVGGQGDLYFVNLGQHPAPGDADRHEQRPRRPRRSRERPGRLG